MSQQTEIPNTTGKIKPPPHTEVVKKVILKNRRAIIEYWPIFLLGQLPLLVVYGLIANPKPAQLPAAPIKIDKKAAEFQKQQSTRLKNLEQRLEGLNQRFLILQNQHAKTVKALIVLKSESNSQRAEHGVASINQTRNLTLEILDRIGEKIRLNEPFTGLLTNISKECVNFSGYQTLHKYAAKLPLTFLQIKKEFDEFYKNYIPQKQDTNLPLWLTKIASFFHGKIKIKKVDQIEVNPLQPLHEALEAQNLKLALVLASDLDFPAVKLWAQKVSERVLLEDQYSIFAEKVQNWAQQSIQENKL